MNKPIIIPDISVLVVSYNQEATIGRAIKSILAQRLGGYTIEVVIADDGSTDATRRVAREYALRYPETVRLLPDRGNRGLTENYFSALKECRGRYAADCAGDDCWLSDERLFRQAFILDNNPDVSIVYSDYILIPADDPSAPIPENTRISKEARIKDGHKLMEPLLAHISPVPIHLSTAMFRIEGVLKELERPTGLINRHDFIVEDIPLIMFLLSKGKAGYLPGDVLAYSVGSETVSNPQSVLRAYRYYKSTLSMTVLLALRYRVYSWRLLKFVMSRLKFVVKLGLKSFIFD